MNVLPVGNIGARIAIEGVGVTIEPAMARVRPNRVPAVICFVLNSGCSKIVRSSYPQKVSRRRSSATPHKGAFEDGGEMAVFQQPACFSRFLTLKLKH